MVNPTGYTALDMIGFTDKGTYLSSENYVKNDLVHYSGNIWRCLIDDTTGIAPAEGVNWTLFIGEPTNLVERIIAPVETDPATSAWAVGRQIIFNDNLYEVIVAITAGDALVTYEDDPTNANIKLADPVETQLLNEESTRAAADLALQNALSHRNLLDNAWFTVNQRGSSSYTLAQREYGFDRWFANAGGESISKSDDTISLVGSTTNQYSGIAQRVERDRLKVGEIYTLSVLFSDGEVEYKTFTLASSGSGFLGGWNHAPKFQAIIISARSDTLWTILPFDALTNLDATTSFKAIKLEKGSISTLAMDTAPDYATELLKCQRYFVRVGSTSRIYLGTALALDNDKATGVIKLPTTMRTVPTVTGITNLELSKGSSIAITALDSRDYNNGYLALTVSASGTTVGSCYLLRVKADANIDFSADL